MVFISDLKFEKIEGLLDTEESVKEAREALERSTEKAFKEFDNAKMAALESAQRIFLD